MILWIWSDVNNERQDAAYPTSEETLDQALRETSLFRCDGIMEKP